MASLGKWAYQYATELGLPVFPVVPRGKRPMTENGHKAATTDPEQINEWWSRWPDANIGCPVPEGCLVLDLDSSEALDELRALDCRIPSTAQAKTGRGFHFWFRHELDQVKNQVQLFPDVDVRAKGGYVLMPPSVHQLGSVYEWIQSPRAIAEAPDWLIDQVCQQDSSAPAEGIVRESSRIDVSQVLGGIPRGMQGTELFRYACRLRGKGIEPEEAGHLLSRAIEAMDQDPRDPFGQDDVDRILRSAWRYDSNTHSLGVVSSDEGETLTIEELMRTEFPPVSWLVDDLLSEGLAVLASAPKIGKSWMVLALALAVAEGGSVLGDRRTALGEVLYLDLEQPPRRTQERIRALPGTRQAGLHFAWKWPTHDQGGFERLEAWLTEHPDTRLVVVDVLAKVIGKKPPGNAYDVEYRIYAGLKEVADRTGTTVLVVHHDNKSQAVDKFDRFSGSKALVAAADTAMFLTRERGTRQGELFVSGREVEDITLPLEFDGFTKLWIPRSAHGPAPLNSGNTMPF